MAKENKHKAVNSNMRFYNCYFVHFPLPMIIGFTFFAAYIFCSYMIAVVTIAKAV